MSIYIHLQFFFYQIHLHIILSFLCPFADQCSFHLHINNVHFIKREPQKIVNYNKIQKVKKKRGKSSLYVLYEQKLLHPYDHHHLQVV